MIIMIDDVRLFAAKMLETEAKVLTIVMIITIYILIDHYNYDYNHHLSSVSNQNAKFIKD